MRTTFLSLLLLLALAISYQLSSAPGGISYVYGSGACDADCMKCHTLSTEEVQKILTTIKIPDAKILKIQISPVRGMWEVSLESNGQRGLFYVDFSKKYLISGQIIEVDAAIDKTRERLSELNKDRRIDRSGISIEDALVLGNMSADKKVIIFTDPDCPFCGKFHAELKKVVQQRKDIAFYIKLFPIVQLHPDALWKSRSILCSKSIKLLEDNFEKKPIPQPECDTNDIYKNIELAESLGISGTPTSIMPDGSVHTGFLEAETLIKIVESLKTVDPVKNKAERRKKL